MPLYDIVPRWGLTYAGVLQQYWRLAGEECRDRCKYQYYQIFGDKYVVTFLFKLIIIIFVCNGHFTESVLLKDKIQMQYFKQVFLKVSCKLNRDIIYNIYVQSWFMELFWQLPENSLACYKLPGEFLRTIL